MIGSLTLIEEQRSARVRAAELSYLPKGEYLKVAVLGYRQLAADLIWLKALQHFGVRQQTDDGYLWAYHAVDVLTDLDPTFIFAYQATGTILAVSAKRVHESVALLKKGMSHNPDAWILPFLLGYDYFFELNDQATAGKYFRIAAALPGSPKFLPHLATKMTVEAGEPDAALEFLQRLYHQVTDESIRAGLAERIKDVLVERDIRFLETGVKRYRTLFGKAPSKLDDLVTRGVISVIPQEPWGQEYRLKPEEGTVVSTSLRERLHLHRR